MGYFSWSPLGTASGTNTGDVTLAAVGAVPNANSASLSGQVLTLQPANGSFPGVVTTAAQTFAGVKTFTSAPVMKGIIDGSSAASGDMFEIITSGDSPTLDAMGTTNQYFDAKSLSFPPGRWLAFALSDITPQSATFTGQMDIGISTTSGDSNTGLVLGVNRRTSTAVPGTSTNSSLHLAGVRINITTTTTHYLKVRVNYTGTPAHRSCLWAIRIG